MAADLSRSDNPLIWWNISERRHTSEGGISLLSTTFSIFEAICPLKPLPQGAIFTRTSRGYHQSDMTTVNAKMSQERMQVEDLVPAAPQDYNHDTVEIDPAYTDDILKFYRMKEVREALPISDSPLRAIAVNWMVTLKRTFDLRQDALIVGLHIFDKVIFKTGGQISPQDNLLVATASMMVASKWDYRGRPLPMKVLSSGSSFTVDDLLFAERFVLRTIHFELGDPFASFFLACFSREVDANNEVMAIAEYLIELSLYDTILCLYPPSVIAVSALAVALATTGRDYWNDGLQKVTGYTLQDIHNITLRLLQLAVSAPTEELTLPTYATFIDRMHEGEPVIRPVSWNLLNGIQKYGEAAATPTNNDDQMDSNEDS